MVTPRQPERLEVEGGHVPVVGPMAMRRPAWWAEAECRVRGLDLALFFPERGEHEKTRTAMAVCAVCAVRVECLSFANEAGIEYGIFGGTTQTQRREMRKAGR